MEKSISFARFSAFTDKMTKLKDNIRIKFSRKDKNVSIKKDGGGFKAFLSKLAGAFLLPISILAIAGLLLGIGATIATQAVSVDANGVEHINYGLRTFGNFIKNLGDPLFGALPLLFAASVAVSFTEEAGVAVFNAIIGYLIFSALQSVFIEPIQTEKEFTRIVNGETESFKLKETVGYSVLFSGGLREPESLLNLVGTSLGFNVLQTSAFGGIIVGFIVQWAYLRFHKIQLPQVISFFGGKRFVAIAVIILMIPLTFLFLIFWPYVGYAFNWFGTNSGKIPYGFDSFIFGFFERCLVPFGLHHVYYAPLWYTSAGANISNDLKQWLEAKDVVHEISTKDLAEILNSLKLKEDTVNALKDLAKTKEYFSSTDVTKYNIIAQVQGDSTTTLALDGAFIDSVKYKVNGEAKELPLFMFIQEELGIRLGRFLQGKFSFMQWGLPAAAAAMVLAAPKENRKVALGTILPAALTCFFVGVTEPIEFTFLFLAPILFFGFHAIMCALSFLLANVFSVHIGMALSGGFLDLIIYGMVPVLKGTNFWWTIVVGLFYIPIYFFTFMFWIKKADLATPGRGGNTKLFSKKDYQAAKEVKKENASSSNNLDQAMKIIEAYGGVDNILKTANCASRLRFDVVDASKVDEEKLKQAGAFGVRKTSKTHVQAIYGPAADQIKVKIDKALAELRKSK